MGKRLISEPKVTIPCYGDLVKSGDVTSGCHGVYTCMCRSGDVINGLYG